MTCRHSWSYTVGTMAQANLQLTIRGVDAETKAALVTRAAQSGVSLNKYVLQSVRQAAGTDSSEERYRRMVAVIDKYRIPSEDIKAAEEAIDWMDKASKEKQKQDEAHGFGV